MENIVSASILSGDFLNLGYDVGRAEDAGCEYIHFDVMDGVFVPNISYGQPVLKAVSSAVKGVLDVHLMITEPIRYVEEFSSCGADIITFHLEAGGDVLNTVNAIRSCGKKAGIAIKPDTPASALEPYLGSADMFLIMTVEPGFGGQSFICEMLEKISSLKKMLSEKGLAVPIEVDGGINDKTAVLAKEAGAEILVAGSYLFNAPDISAAAEKLKKERQNVVKR